MNTMCLLATLEPAVFVYLCVLCKEIDLLLCVRIRSENGAGSFSWLSFL